jgi:ABC-type phosphate transport system permease subunit
VQERSDTFCFLVFVFSCSFFVSLFVSLFTFFLKLATTIIRKEKLEGTEVEKSWKQRNRATNVMNLIWLFVPISVAVILQSVIAGLYRAHTLEVLEKREVDNCL